ncbi:MAG TPA: polysaccharide biosynthesis tyrosine autokinase [Methylomirabilota bacterium]|nr:polysaccharide biosynthesis tyrosine autokinase [Methylomirabilota bacterium]
MDTRTVIKQVAISLFARRKKWIALTTLAALVLLVPVAYLLSKEPPRFRTTATILIDNKAERAPVFQEFSPYRPLPVQLAILQSRLLAASVVEALPKASVDDLLHNPYGRDYVGDLLDWVARMRGDASAVPTPHRRAVAELRRDRMKFLSQSTSSGIVEIQAEASQPQIALDIANTYIDVLLTRTRSFNVDDAKNTREYLSQQTAQVAEALTRSEASLRAFTMSRGGVQIPTKSTETAQRLSQLETTLAEVQANKSISQTRLSSLKTKLEALPAPQAPVKATPAPAATPSASAANAPRLRAKLSSLEAQMVEAKTRYSDDHPRVRSLAQQIADVQRELGDVVKDTTAASSAVGTIPVDDRSAFSDMVAALETSVVSLSAQENALKDQITAARRDLSGLSKDELEYRRLASEVETNRKLSTLLSDKLGAARIREQGEMNVVKVIDPPSFPTAAPNQRRMQFVGLALALALVIGLGAPATAEYFNRPIMGETDVKHLTALPILTTIPQVQSQKVLFNSGDGQSSSQEDYHLFVDAFRRLRVELQMIGDETPLRRILIASSLPFEGKSTVVFNLGLALGEVGKKVMIADADFHRPTLHRIANATPRKGFTDLLAGTTKLGDTVTAITENVQLTPRGSSLTAPARSGLGTDRLARILSDMADEADYVLMDSSPILLIPDNMYMAAAADGIILVVAVGQTRPRDLLRTKAILERAGTPIVGVVLNRTPVKQLNSYYRQYSGYYSA